MSSLFHHQKIRVMEGYHPWFPLARNITRSAFFKSSGCVGLFGLLLAMAAREESVTEGRPLMVGQLCVNYSFLCDYFKKSLQWVRTRLDHLKKSNAIFVDGSNHRYLLITIRHYNDSLFAAASDRGGWVKFYDEVTDCVWFRDPDCACVYIDLLCKSYHPGTGESVRVSIIRLMRETGLSRVKILESLVRLHKSGVIKTNYRKSQDRINVTFVNGGTELPEIDTPKSLTYIESDSCEAVQHTKNTSSPDGSQKPNKQKNVKSDELQNELNDSGTGDYEAVQHTTIIPEPFQDVVNESENEEKTAGKPVIYNSKERDRDIIKNKKNNTHVCARGEDIPAFLKHDLEWQGKIVSYFGGEYGLCTADIQKFLDVFALNLEVTGITHTDVSEFKGHFSRWLGKQLLTVGVKSLLDKWGIIHALEEKTRREETAREKWQHCQRQFESSVSADEYRAIFGTLKLESYNEETGKLLLQVPSADVYESLESKYIGVLGKVFHGCFGPNISLGYRIARRSVPSA